MEVVLPVLETQAFAAHGRSTNTEWLLDAGAAYHHVTMSPVLRENTDLVDGHSMPKSCRNQASHMLYVC